MNFDFVKQLLPGIGKALLLIVLFLILPVKNILTTNLLVLSWVLTFKLRTEIMSKVNPLPREWFVICLKTLVITNLFLVLWWAAGYLGLIGLLLISLALGAWRIYTGRELFNQFTTWAADRLWGRTKEDFKMEGGGVVVDKGRRKDEDDNAESGVERK